jgi:hypothetical protein
MLAARLDVLRFYSRRSSQNTPALIGTTTELSEYEWRKETHRVPRRRPGTGEGANLLRTMTCCRG